MQNSNLEAGTDAQALEECYLLACFHDLLSMPSYAIQGYQPRSSGA